MDNHILAIVSEVLLDKRIFNESHVGCHCSSGSKFQHRSLVASCFQLLVAWFKTGDCCFYNKRYNTERCNANCPCILNLSYIYINRGHSSGHVHFLELFRKKRMDDTR